jgi:hypothetical protein
MVWAPGQSGNPNGYKGPRERRRKEVFDIIKNLGHKDALETLSYLQHNEQIEPGLRIAAAAALAPYCHPKMQSTPTPRYVELQIDVPEFTNVSVAEDFLARILSLVARGHLDIQQGQELAGLAKMYIDSQYARDELQFKINPPETRDTTITITGGLPALPGTKIDMPVLNGHAVSEQLLAAPQDVVPHAAYQYAAEGTNQVPSETVTEIFPTPGELKAQGPHPLQERHFKPEEDGLARQNSPAEPGKNSTNGGQEPCT